MIDTEQRIALLEESNKNLMGLIKKVIDVFEIAILSKANNPVLQRLVKEFETISSSRANEKINDFLKKEFSVFNIPDFTSEEFLAFLYPEIEDGKEYIPPSVVRQIIAGKTKEELKNVCWILFQLNIGRYRKSQVENFERNFQIFYDSMMVKLEGTFTSAKKEVIAERYGISMHQISNICKYFDVLVIK